MVLEEGMTAEEVKAALDGNKIAVAARYENQVIVNDIGGGFKVYSAIEENIVEEAVAAVEIEEAAKPCVKCGSVVEDAEFTLCDNCLFDVVVMGEREAATEKTELPNGEKVTTVTEEDGSKADVRGINGTFWVDHEGGTVGPFDTKKQAIKEAKAILYKTMMDTDYETGFKDPYTSVPYGNRPKRDTGFEKGQF
jgi:hypothetical protein